MRRAAEILSRIGSRGAAMGGRALTLYTQVWQLRGVSDADGFAALAAAAAIKGVVSAAAAMRRKQWNFDIRSAMIEF